MESLKNILYWEGCFNEIMEYPVRISKGLYVTVISGTAILNTGAESYHLKPQMDLSFISGGIFQCIEHSVDFKVRIFGYTHELFTRAALPIDRIFFDYFEEHPYYLHTTDERSQRTWREVLQWMDLAQTLFGGVMKLRFPELQEENFLRGFWMWNISTIQDRIETRNNISNAQLIAHKFIRLVKNNAIIYHKANYYADRLNITQRYLNKIIYLYCNCRTPKQLIDAQLIAEIKEHLIDATYSVTQIAADLNFPDQSSLSRFFSRHTGMSPLEYRAKIQR